MGDARHRDLLACCAGAAVAALAVAATDSTVLRTALGLPAALLLPGHALLRALGIGTRTPSEHLTYAVGASLVVGIAGGFALNAVHLLSPVGWAAWFLASTAACSFAAVRRKGLPDLPAWPGPSRILPWHAAVVGLSVLLATGGYALAVRDEAAQRQFVYTEFWAVPSADGGRVTVGVRSAEDRPQTFDVEVALDDAPLAVLRSIGVPPGGTWTREFVVPPVSGPRKIAARLYRPEDHRLYRSVSALLSRN